MGDFDLLGDALRRGFSSGVGDFFLEDLLVSGLLSTDFRLVLYLSALFFGGESFLLGSGEGLRLRCSLSGGDSLLSL